MRQIIGLMGKAGCGKSTAASVLAGYGYQRMRFAQPLKAMLRTLGLTVEQTDGDQKEIPCSLLGGKTPRWAMQTLGTEWGRDLIDQDLWVRAAMKVVRDKGGFFVFDDVRFDNEATAIWDAGGSIWRIGREQTIVTAANHISEQAVADLLPDLYLANNGTIADLQERINEHML